MLKKFTIFTKELPVKQFIYLVLLCGVLPLAAANVSIPLADAESPIFQATSVAHEVYGVILAGGIGERLWPLSRQDRPKQFLPLIGERSLLEITRDRLEGVNGTKRYWAVTTAPLENGVRLLLQGKLDDVIVEPARRNTAAALLFTCFRIAQRSPEAQVIFLPSDQYISDARILAQALNAALGNSLPGHITLLGIKPSYPATGYGYIKVASELTESSPNSPVPLQVAPVAGFYEKPTYDKAQEYVRADNMLWNAGIFCGKVSSFIRQFEQYAPDIYESVLAFLEGRASYEDIPATSIDYAVLEKSSAVSVVPVSFEWADIGSLSSLLGFRAEYNKPGHAELCVNCAGNLVHTSKKLVALIDVEGLCIADTDDVLLVVPCKSSERVKLALEELKRDEGAYRQYS